MSESKEISSWTTQCGSQTVRILRKTPDDGKTIWVIDSGIIRPAGSAPPHVDSLTDAECIFNTIKGFVEADHQNNRRCCISPDYTIGPTRESAEPEEKLAYATPCGDKFISVVRKTTMTGRDVWDITNGHDDHPVAMMFDTFADAKIVFENNIEMIKAVHAECCIISD